MIDQRIKNLQSTTFCGQRFNRKQIVDIQNTVIGFPMLSRKELGLNMGKPITVFWI